MRPKIISHLISSVDGRLITDRYSAAAAGIDRSTLLDCYNQISDEFQADGWAVGRQTMEEVVEDFPKKEWRSSANGENLRETFVGNRKGRNLAVCFDSKGKCHYGQDNAYGDHLVAVLGEQVSDDYLSELKADGVSYLFAGPAGHDLDRALKTLGDAFKVKTLILQGGAIITGAFLKAGLIDEISILIYPGIDGLSGMPSIIECKGGPDDQPAAGQSLRHLETKTLEGGIVWIHYAVERTK